MLNFWSFGKLLSFGPLIFNNNKILFRWFFDEIFHDLLLTFLNAFRPNRVENQLIIKWWWIKLWLFFKEFDEQHRKVEHYCSWVLMIFMATLNNKDLISLVIQECLIKSYPFSMQIKKNHFLHNSTVNDHSQ